MQIFDCAVRLAGDMNNVVPLLGITASEIVLLRRIHGDDAIIDIEYRKNVDLQKQGSLGTSVDVYAKLEKKYGKSRENLDHLKELFGAPENPKLVGTLPGYDFDEKTDTTGQNAEDEKDDLKAWLDENEIKYHPNLGLEKLRILRSENDEDYEIPQE